MQLCTGNEVLAKNLATFDTLDYTVFRSQEWLRLHESHAKDIKVNWSDGHFTMGIEQHIKYLDAMFVYAPDTRWFAFYNICFAVSTVIARCPESPSPRMPVIFTDFQPQFIGSSPCSTEHPCSSPAHRYIFASSNNKQP